MFPAIKRTTRIALTGISAAALLLAGCNQLTRTAVNATNPDGSAAQTGTNITITRGVVESTIVATGKVIPRETANISFQRAGQVISITVAEGQAATKGQPLAMLDTASLELAAQQQYLNYLSAQAAYSQTIKGPSEAEVASAMASLKSAEASYADLLKPPSEYDVASLKASLDNARAALEQAQASYDRAFQRNPAGIGGSSEGLSLQQATNNYEAAKANYDKAFQKATNSALANASAQIASAKLKLESLTPVTETIIQSKAKLDQAYLTWQQAQDDIANTAITAPFDGVVTSVPFRVGDTVGSGQTVVAMSSVANPWFEIDIDEADLGNVTVGQAARVQLQAYPNQPISATIESIAVSGSTASSSVTFKVKLALGGAGTRFPAGAPAGGGMPRPGAGRPGAQAGQAMSGTLPADARPMSGTLALQNHPVIRMGMSGTAEVITAQKQDVIAVPNGALSADRVTRNYTVLKVTGETVQTVVVTVGLRGSSMSEITEGLSEGDVISIPRTASASTTGFGAGGGAFMQGAPGGR
jgi:multidrug efflux pump subunit AcrA (membrane-fusion protein)